MAMVYIKKRGSVKPGKGLADPNGVNSVSVWRSDPSPRSMLWNLNVRKFQGLFYNPSPGQVYKSGCAVSSQKVWVYPESEIWVSSHTRLRLTQGKGRLVK